MNNNGHNNSCDFSEALVSYLYGEIGAVESNKFKAHLAQCSHCAEELAGFGALRSSVVEWRQEEFAPMSAPAIELPVHAAPVVVTDETSVSWLDSIRAFFTPPVMLGAAGFAAVLVVLGLAFALLNSGNSNRENLLAANEPQKEIKQPVKTTGTEPEKVNEVAKTATPAPKEIENIAPVKNVTKTPKVVRDYQLKNNVAGRTKPQTTPRELKRSDTYLDTELYKETEDESLRLADLFGEAGTE